MNLVELKQKLPYKVRSSESWLENNYPSRPEDRCQKITKENFQNIEDVFGIDARKRIEQGVKKFPDVPVVILAKLPKSGNIPKKPREVAFVKENVSYYRQYELFASSAHLDGFIEVFHHGVKK